MMENGLTLLSKQPEITESLDAKPQADNALVNGVPSQPTELSRVELQASDCQVKEALEQADETVEEVVESVNWDRRLFAPGIILGTFCLYFAQLSSLVI